MGRNGEMKPSQYSFLLINFMSVVLIFCHFKRLILVAGYCSIRERSFGFSIEVIPVLKKFPPPGGNVDINKTRQVIVPFLRITGAINFS